MSTSSANAQQIKIDETTQTQLENCPGNCIIKGGLEQGNNLFHSFERFNVGVGDSVLFQDSGIINIIGRVTGNGISEILGTLGVSGGDANLFLLNPNGIVFGENSSLNLNGSFMATTADAIRFGEQGLLSASSNEIPLLTINPSALFFSQENQGKIVNQSTEPAGSDLSGFSMFGLRVPNGDSLLLIAEDLVIDGGSVIALGGRIELGGLAEEGEIKINFPNNNKHNIYLDFPETLQKADVSIVNGPLINVISENGGNIIINARDLIIANESLLWAGIGSNLGTENSQAGSINLNVTEDLVIKNNSAVENSIFPEALGFAKGINITAGTLSINDNSSVQAIIFGKGNAGNIRIKVDEGLVEINNNSYIASVIQSLSLDNFQSQAIGDAGNIQINSESILLSNESRIEASTFGEGNAGNINLNDLESLQLQNGSQITTSASDEATGGNITIGIEESLTLEGNNNLISALATDRADGGNVNIDADFIIAFPNQNNDILASAQQGDGGKINISAESLFGIEERPSNNQTNDLNASSEVGIDGSVTINTPDVNPAEGSINLPQDFAVPPLDNSCQGIGAEESSSFVDLGRGGIPENPQQIRDNGRIWDDLRSPIIENNNKLNSNIKLNQNESIVEAQGWIVGKNGKIILVANNKEINSGNRNSLNCKHK